MKLKTWISLGRSVICTFALAATAVMIGCAGVSTSTKTATDPGTSASTHVVDLSWNASTSADVSGYNLYRAGYTSSCGSFSKINAAMIVNTWYKDSEVTSGTSYCYATTAVDISNRESAFSNVVTNIQIPTP